MLHKRSSEPGSGSKHEAPSGEPLSVWAFAGNVSLFLSETQKAVITKAVSDATTQTDEVLAWHNSKPLRALYRRVCAANPARRLLLDTELTQRGVPPSLRFAPYADEDAPAEVTAAFLADVQWLAARYPNHRASDDARQLFNPATFLPSARRLWRRKHRWSVIAALQLSEAQQLECALLCAGNAIRKRRAFRAKLPSVREALYRAQTLKRTDPQPPASFAQPGSTVVRRALVWELAEVLSWQPSRVAEAYEGLTGRPMSRHVARKVMDEATQDVRRGRESLM